MHFSMLLRLMRIKSSVRDTSLFSECRTESLRIYSKPTTISALRTSKTYLGAQFRRLRSRLDTPVAIKAMAAKLARLVYRILRYGMKYVDRGAAFYEAQHRQRQIKHLKSKASKLGFQIIQVPAA